MTALIELPQFLFLGRFIGDFLHKFILISLACLFQSLAVVGWIVATASSLAVIYGLIDYARGATPSKGLSAFYNAVSRSVWGAGVAWVIFACARGCGGMYIKVFTKAIPSILRTVFCITLMSKNRQAGIKIDFFL